MGKKSNATRFPVVGSQLIQVLSSKLTANETKSNQARIKKLIQADEDVGKVAGGTPVVVCELISRSIPSAV
jgi:hypothetical protein